MGVDNANGGPDADYAGTQSSSESKSNAALDSAINAAMTDVDGGGQEPDPVEAPDEVPSGEGEAVESEPAAEPGPDEPDQNASAEDTQTKPDGQSGISDDAPEHWNKEWRDTYSRLPEDAKRFAREMDKTWARGFQQKMQEFQEDRRYAENIRASIPDPVRQTLQANGFSEAQFVDNMARWYVALQQNPQEALEKLREQLRLPDQPETPSQQGQVNQQDEWVDPEIQGLRSEFGTIKQTLEQERQERERLQRDFQQMTTAQRHAHAESQIQQFAKETDEAGNARYPYFDQVQQHMTALMQTDPQLRAMPAGREKLAAAYEKAVEPFQEQLQMAQERQRELQEKQAHTDKVRAAATPKPRPGSSAPAKEKPRDLDSIIKSQMSQAGF